MKKLNVWTVAAVGLGFLAAEYVKKNFGTKIGL